MKWKNLFLALALGSVAQAESITPSSEEAWRDWDELPAARIEDYDPNGYNVAWQLENLDDDGPLESWLETMEPVYGGYELPTTLYSDTYTGSDPESAWIAYLKANMQFYGLLPPDEPAPALIEPEPVPPPVLAFAAALAPPPGPPGGSNLALSAGEPVPELSPGAASLLGLALVAGAALFRTSGAARTE